ncbi:hypothetical protein BJ508DRAFT_324745 [Ascobolus immersus RN42]|uniref:Uncharacterized protein n=1 Tax=Ascobolus immersus RN42 TaxID=1160509 RepID=A0A3N4IG44_ASCIM|nr:hypothetical protein BJ508DRAFT_324745 [Ascobolus immersus RN42]
MEKKTNDAESPPSTPSSVFSPPPSPILSSLVHSSNPTPIRKLHLLTLSTSHRCRSYWQIRQCVKAFEINTPDLIAQHSGGALESLATELCKLGEYERDALLDFIRGETGRRGCELALACLRVRMREDGSTVEMMIVGLVEKV